MTQRTPSYSVAQITAYIKNMFASDFVLRALCVTGEISNLKYHSSGHIYFTLKDEKAAISAVMFASNARGLGFTLKDGMKVLAAGSVSVYEKAGTYQLYVRSIRQAGLGDLYKIYQERLQRLRETGLFDSRYKKPIPKYAQSVGIVTSPTGAAIRDICNVSRRRNPFVRLVLCPALVQGESAAVSIVRGIETLDGMGLDVLIVGRGGGSIEDLWAFNEENVVRAVFSAKTPVISAVGHETDVTLTDFAADLRAPTPSAAAELAVFDLAEYLRRVRDRRENLGQRMRQQIRRARLQADTLEQRLKRRDPRAELNGMRQRLAMGEEQLESGMHTVLERSRGRLERSAVFLKHRMDTERRQARSRLSVAASRLDGVSPLRRFSAGYSFTETADGRAVRSIRMLNVQDIVHLYFSDGSADAAVKAVSARADSGKG